MFGWSLILSAAAGWEARALAGKCPTLSSIIRKAPRPLLFAVWLWSWHHFLRKVAP